MEDKKIYHAFMKTTRWWFIHAKCCIALLSVFLFILYPYKVDAANLYFAPGSGSYAVGGTFSVGVYVASSDQAMNAVSGTVSFPADMLQVTSVSKGGSVINFWVSEPSFSNGVGTVNFEGVVLNPGYTGSGGKIINVGFKAIKEGTSNVSFSSASVLANDGQGTSILSGRGTARFTITPPPEKPPEEKPPVVEPEKPPEEVPVAPPAEIAPPVEIVAPVQVQPLFDMRSLTLLLVVFFIFLIVFIIIVTGIFTYFWTGRNKHKVPTDLIAEVDRIQRALMVVRRSVNNDLKRLQKISHDRQGMEAEEQKIIERIRSSMDLLQPIGHKRKIKE